MRCILLLAGAMLGLPAGAEDLSMVGRVLGASGKADAAICTGTLVAPRLVLTAAHCLAGAQELPAGLIFQAGYRDGQMAGVAAGQAIILAAGNKRGNWPADAGLLVLQDPINLPPLSVGGLLSPELSLLLYSRSAPEAPVMNEDCPLLRDDGKLVLIDCPVVSGNSGGPVLLHDGTGWRVVAIVVAQSGDRAFAIHIPPDILAHIATGGPLPAAAGTP